MYTAIDRRIETLKREKAIQKESGDESAEPSENKICEQKEDKEEDLKDKKIENIDKENDEKDKGSDTIASECTKETDNTV